MNLHKDIVLRLKTKRKPIHYKAIREAVEQLEEHTDTVNLNLPKEKTDEFDLTSDGTYSFETGENISFESGYQVSFERPEHSDAKRVKGYKEFLAASSDGTAYLGYFEGVPEFSFHFSDFDTAMGLAKKYNQMGIWDWGAPVEDGFIPNPDFVDPTEILQTSTEAYTAEELNLNKKIITTVRTSIDKEPKHRTELEAAGFTISDSVFYNSRKEKKPGWVVSYKKNSLFVVYYERNYRDIPEFVLITGTRETHHLGEVSKVYQTLNVVGYLKKDYEVYGKQFTNEEKLKPTFYDKSPGTSPNIKKYKELKAKLTYAQNQQLDDKNRDYHLSEIERQRKLYEDRIRYHVQELKAMDEDVLKYSDELQQFKNELGFKKKKDWYDED